LSIDGHLQRDRDDEHDGGENCRHFEQGTDCIVREGYRRDKADQRRAS
jgi:hypothetical protein